MKMCAIYKLLPDVIICGLGKSTEKCAQLTNGGVGGGYNSWLGQDSMKKRK